MVYSKSGCLESYSGNTSIHCLTFFSKLGICVGKCEFQVPHYQVILSSDLSGSCLRVRNKLYLESVLVERDLFNAYSSTPNDQGLSLRNEKCKVEP